MVMVSLIQSIHVGKKVYRSYAKHGLVVWSWFGTRPYRLGRPNVLTTITR